MAHRPTTSIRARLFLLVIAVAVPLAAVLAWGFWQQVDREHRDARELALRIARSYAGDLRDANVRSDALLARMAARPKISLPDAHDCDSLFAIVDFFPQYLNLLLYDTAGELVCSATPQPADTKISRAAERDIGEWLRGAHRPGGDPLLRHVDGRWISIAFRDVSHDGLRTGVLALVQYFDLDVSSFPEGTVITIADEEGTIVARSSGAAKWVGRSIRDTELVRLTSQSREGRAEARGIDGELRQYGYTRVDGTGWHVFVGVPAGVAMAAVRSLLLRGAVAGLIALACVTLLAVRIASTIERPLETLAGAAQRTGEEGFGFRVPAGGPREVAALADAFNRMVGNRADAEAALVESRGQLQALSKRLLDIQEEERSRIARDVHDQLGQMLTALKMDVGGLLRTTTPLTAEQSALAARIRRELDQTISSVQRIAAELRPAILDDFGLAAAIQSDVRAFEERTGIECELSIAEEPVPLDPEREAAVYRIVQEAMTNVARHSDATRVEVRLRVRSGEMLLEIRDDGRGITGAELNDRASVGIAGMRERARRVGGGIEIEGVPDRGTIVCLRVPILPNRARSAS